MRRSARARATTRKSPSTAPSRPSCRQEAHPADHGHRHGQDRRRLPDLLEALEHRAGTAQANTGARRFSTWPTAISWSTIPRTRSSRPSAMPAARSRTARSSRAGRCTSPSTRPSPRTSAGPGSTRNTRRDFFDLIIVDECHRGSAKDDSNWREILEYFEPAYQLGMTATPLRDDNRDTYRYFGNPIYTYSLRQGIDDGFLAPYRVHRIVTEWDAAGWRPSQGDLDRYGREIPDEEYQTADFERAVALQARTQAIARHLTDFLKKTDRFAKTIVFCVDQEHADEMRARAQQPERRPGPAVSRTTSAASPPTRATSAAATSARFRTSRRVRPSSSPRRSCSPPASTRPPARTSSSLAWSTPWSSSSRSSAAARGCATTTASSFQHPRLHRLRHPPLRRPGLRRRARAGHRAGDDRNG